MQNKINELTARFQDDKDLVKRLIRLQKVGYHGPYRFGCVHNLLWGDARYISENYDTPWNSPMPLPCYNVKLFNGILGLDVHNGNTDPLPWIDNQYKASLNIIKDYAKRELTIATRSDLIASNEYLSALNPKLHKVRIHVLSMPEATVRLVEPGAPSVKRRIEAAIALKANGIQVTVHLDIIPHANRKEYITQLNDAGLKFEFNTPKLHGRALQALNDLLGEDKPLTPQERATQLGIRVIRGGS